MTSLFLTVFNMSVTGAFVIAAICVARLPLKRAPKIVSYCLWIVAGFRLVFPFSVESMFSLVPFGDVVPNTTVNNVSFLGNTPETYAALSPLAVFIAIASYVWFAGFLVMFLFGTLSYIKLSKKMSESVHIEDNIYKAHVESPFVMGFIEPKIYLPFNLPTDEREHVLLHEKTHIFRKDHYARFAAYVILCLHWFNPAVWAAFLLMGRDMEMSCDEKVLTQMGGEETMYLKKRYCTSLLSLAASKSEVSIPPPAFGGGDIKKRVKNILKFKKVSKTAFGASIILAASLSAGLMVDRTFGADYIHIVVGNVQHNIRVGDIGGVVHTRAALHEENLNVELVDLWGYVIITGEDNLRSFTENGLYVWHDTFGSTNIDSVRLDVEPAENLLDWYYVHHQQHEVSRFHMDDETEYIVVDFNINLSNDNENHIDKDYINIYRTFPIE